MRQYVAYIVNTPEQQDISNMCVLFLFKMQFMMRTSHQCVIFHTIHLIYVN